MNSRGGQEVSTEPTACPVCGTVDVALIGRLQDRRRFAGVVRDRPLIGGNLFRCSTCSLKFRSPHSPPEFYAELYDNSFTTAWEETTGRNDWNKILQFIQPRLRADAKVLDFGCNTGGLLAQLGQRYSKYGIEINKSAGAVAVAESGATVWSSLEEIPPGLRFDAIILADVVEHVPDPKQLIVAVAAYLAEGGVLLITTGDADNRLWERFGANWWYCVYPEHIAFISRAWLGYLCRSTDLTIKHCENFYYCDLPLPRKVSDGLLAMTYGLAPSFYSRVGRLILATLRLRGDVPVGGRGLSADHLFIALAKRSQ